MRKLFRKKTKDPAIVTDVNSIWATLPPTQDKNSNDYKSWSDKSICLEIFIHRKHDQSLCLDCQRYWDSWTEFQRNVAIVVGRHHYNDMYGLKDDGKP